ncbi:MAG: DivIVA domain-containing protein [Desulfobacca sp.]|uniref:DivIVA domain-containing protein n=1 Tax=Desulfobacca sp. TaxID=2067990 RepID=UPI0040495791
MAQMDNLTPAEIRQKQFSTVRKGFDPAEVKAFLEQLAEALVAGKQEIDALRADLERQQGELQEFKKREQLLKDTLINAQQVIETMKANAQKEAELLIHEAEIKAEKLLQEAFARQGKVRNDIDELKRLKVTLAAQVRGILETHQRLLAEIEAGE